MPWRSTNLLDNLKAASVIIALAGSLFGVVSYFSDIVHSQAATALDVQKLNSHVAAIEDVIQKTNLDRFRIDRSEQDVAKLGRQIDDVQRTVFDIRLMLEKMTATGK